MDNKIQNVKLRYLLSYLLADYFSAVLAWYSFGALQEHLQYSFLVYPEKLFGNLNTWLFVPAFWLGVYLFYGSYSQILRKSRFKELYSTLRAAFVGSIILYFLLITGEAIVLRPLLQIILLASLHFTASFIPRYFITRKLVKSFHRLHLSIPSLVIAEASSLPSIRQKLQEEAVSMGNRIVGYVAYEEKKQEKNSSQDFPFLGFLPELAQVIQDQDIQELILTQEKNMSERILQVLASITAFPYLRVKIMPSFEGNPLESSTLESVLATPWVFITTRPLNGFQRLIKRVLDFTGALLFLLLCFPIFIVLALWIPLNSKGPIFFKQTRIGYLGQAFRMFKFRTMYIDAEKNGPQLSSKNDVRITSLGRFLRKTRIDELPQLLNVLRGEMSLVGPRPERQFYIDQIAKRVPYYKLLHSVRPGITSLGQIRYGYAENLEQMLERLKYDLIYIQQQSLTLDLKILLYTISILLQAKGK